MPSARSPRRRAAIPPRVAAVVLGAALTVALASRAGSQAVAPPTSPLSYVRVAAGVLTGVQAILWLRGGGGSDLLAVGFADRLEVGELTADHRWNVSFRLPVPAGVSALAAADLDGSGAQDLIVGTGGAGSLVRIRSVADRPLAVPVSGYLFGAARRIAPAELDGRPPAEILVTNANDELFVFSAAAGGGYRRIWRSPPGMVVQAVAAGDFDGDGASEVAVARGTDPVTVYRWTRGELAAIGTVFPWGQVTGLAAVREPTQVVAQPPAAVPARLAVATDRNLVYVYAWDGQRLQAQRLVTDPDQRFRLDLDWMRASGVPPGDGRPSAALVVEGAGGSGLQMVRVDADRLTVLAHVRWPGAAADFARLHDGRLAVLGPEGSVDVLRPERAGYLVIRVDGQEARPTEMRLRWEGDQPLVDVEQMGSVLPVAVAYDRAGGQATLRAGTSRVVLHAGLASAQGDRMSTPLSLAPYHDPASGRLFVPFDSVRPLGWSVTYDPRARELALRSPWPVGYP